MTALDEVQSPVASPAQEDGAALLARRQPLPAEFSRDARVAAAAAILAKAGAAVAPNASAGVKILTALESLDALAGLDGDLCATWLALRALGLPAGAQIGIAAADLSCPITIKLIEAAGYIPTTDTDDTVRGVLGDLGLRDVATMAQAARIVTRLGDQLTVASAQDILFVTPTTSAGQALTTIDSKAPARTVSRAMGIAPLDYTPVTDARHNALTQAVFCGYNVRRISIPGAQPHVTDLVESAALASVLPPVPSYRPFLHHDVVARGILSDVQLEAVIYAGEAHAKYLPSHPDDQTRLAPRRGILIGHGTGVGKSRICGGIIADNWAQGRRRHLWLTESSRLMDDVRQEWISMGGKAEDIIDIRDFPHGAPIPPMTGIMFASYASLRLESENGSRMKQMSDWFGIGEDGVLVFDEAQNMRNAKNANESEISKQGRAALDLQDRLPNARVVYASATSATDIGSMGFAIRLGLWGHGTAFPTARRFFEEMEQGGTNALEMVARDLKAMGLYLAANLSFEGVSYERLQRSLTSEERRTQDEMAAIWLEVNAGLRRALRYTNAAYVPKTTRGSFHRLGTTYFGMTRARFFQGLLTSLNTPQMIDAIRDDLKNGHAAIVQLTNTFEANSDKALLEAEASNTAIDDIEASPREIILGYLHQFFPVTKVVTSKKNGIRVSGPELDKDGKPVIEPRALALRNDLIARVNALSIPEGPLEQLLRAFGPGQVSEITGRTRRLVRDVTGKQYLEERTTEDVRDDLQAFMNDQKSILVFSQAGATGATYSAQKTCKNQRLRRHYVLQAGWRSDLALQGMGRSHRSNQAQPPEYVLLSTDLWANQRMISAVARGMRDLGALTRGLRQAASQDFFTQDDNLEDDLAQEAWVRFVAKLANGEIHGLSIAQFEAEACFSLRKPNGSLLASPPPLRRFLNAMSAMSCDNQTLFGQHYRAELEAVKIEAVEDGRFDRGIETIVPDSLIKLEDAVIYQDPRTGGETRILRMLRIDELTPLTYAEARRQALTKGNTRIVKSVMTGRIAILCFPRYDATRPPAAQDPIEVLTPTGSRMRTREEVVQERWVQVDVTIAENLWTAEMHERGVEEEREFWVISGTMLPIWDKLPRHGVTVYRMETDEGEQIIGRVVTDAFVGNFLQRVDALTGGGLPQDEVASALLRGGLVTLVNGWTLKGRTNATSGLVGIHLMMPEGDVTPYNTMIQAARLKAIPGALGHMAYLALPQDESGMQRSLGFILAEAQAVSAVVL